MARASTHSAAAGGGGFQGTYQGFGDLFDTLFGGAASAGRRPRTPTGADLRYDLRLTFAESISGAEKEIEFNSAAKCPTCGGNGAEPGTEPTTCPKCKGTGELRNVRQTMLGQMINVTSATAAVAQARSSRRRATPAMARDACSRSARCA